MSVTKNKNRVLYAALLDQLRNTHECIILDVNAAKIPLVRLTAQIEMNHPLLWTKNQVFYPKAYFRDVSGYLTIGLGRLFSVNVFPKIQAVQGKKARKIKFFGGSSFFAKNSKHVLWDDFPKAYYFLPVIEIESLGAQCHLHLHLLYEGSMHKLTSDIDDIVSSLHFDTEGEYQQRYSHESQMSVPSFQAWSKLMKKAIDEIYDEKISKVVLARMTTITYRENLCPYSILSRICKQNTSHFSFQPSSTSSFIGATPEMLYERHHQDISSVAIAGSRPRNPCPIQDETLAKILLNSRKETREFDFVRIFIEEQFKKLCQSSATTCKKGVIRTKFIQHLYQKFQGTLKCSEFPDDQIITLLHPTPAMGGFPKQPAMGFLERNEEFDRGWYASPIGFLSLDYAKFYVGIRSALVLDNQLHAFAGVGIVKDSKAELEWQELNDKISQYLGE